MCFCEGDVGGDDCGEWSWLLEGFLDEAIQSISESGRKTARCGGDCWPLVKPLRPYEDVRGGMAFGDCRLWVAIVREKAAGRGKLSLSWPGRCEQSNARLGLQCVFTAARLRRAERGIAGQGALRGTRQESRRKVETEAGNRYIDIGGGISWDGEGWKHRA